MSYLTSNRNTESKVTKRSFSVVCVLNLTVEISCWGKDTFRDAQSRMAPLMQIQVRVSIARWDSLRKLTQSGPPSPSIVKFTPPYNMFADIVIDSSDFSLHLCTRCFITLQNKCVQSTTPLWNNSVRFYITILFILDDVIWHLPCFLPTFHPATNTHLSVVCWILT